MQNRSKTPFEARMAAERQRSARRRTVILIVIALVLVAGLVLLLNRNTSTTELSALRLICYANQDVTPFGSNVLYYDGSSIHCLADNGAIRWSYSAGVGAEFSASEQYVSICQGNTLTILDSNGRITYTENLSQEIQFTRISNHYVAVLLGGDTTPDLVIKDLQGIQVDEESEAFSGMLMLDVGFYGENDQYMWTLCMDVYSTAVNSVLNTFQVGKMNTGEVSLGNKLAYKVQYDNGKLRVFTTQQMFTYDYKAVIDSSATTLIHGWQYLDFEARRNDGYILLSPTNLQAGDRQTYDELRLLSGSNDRRYSLPSLCFGSVVHGQSIYAFSENYLYRVDIDTKKSFAYADPLPEGHSGDTLLGKTADGKVLIGSGSDVYIVTLPE